MKLNIYYVCIVIHHKFLNLIIVLIVNKNCQLFCSKCILYDNDQTKDIYHCDKCGICRLGLGLEKDYFHCDTCNTCLSIDLKGHHKCLSDVTHSNCCICNEDLFS